MPVTHPDSVALFVLNIWVENAERKARHSLHLPFERGVEGFKDNAISVMMEGGGSRFRTDIKTAPTQPRRTRRVAPARSRVRASLIVAVLLSYT
jgi:hypothetical protein